VTSEPEQSELRFVTQEDLRNPKQNKATSQKTLEKVDRDDVADPFTFTRSSSSSNDDGSNSGAVLNKDNSQRNKKKAGSQQQREEEFVHYEDLRKRNRQDKYPDGYSVGSYKH
jgi:hypothetical protein